MANSGVAVSMIFPIMKTIVQQGYDTQSFFRSVGFNTALLEDPEARLPGAELERLIMAAAAFTHDEHFGLHQGELMDFADMGVVGYVMMHSKTIADALSAYQRYNTLLCSSFNIDWSLQGFEVSLRLFAQYPSGLTRHCIEEMAVSMQRMISRLSNRSTPLHAVHFTHEAPSHTEPYRESFGLPPAFSQKENLLVMNKEVLEYPVLYSDPKLLSVFQSLAQATQAELNRDDRLSERIVQWMKTCIPTFLPTLKQTAESLGLSERTVQHKLKEEQTTYHELSVRVRKELAIAYLKRKEFTIGDIAYALHYSEPSAFQLAFKKWTGMTPGQYRANAVKENR
ncbi:AraC family transcriptional regulator [Paenibacillus turpanensis]|uniref:AraC family transcriptional regulator n=1 Tax=Paenibacillus turpanensis TaxID=2689078 RepID=UPI0014073001|nr:AraC family transcriptional regulator [Paenibacillus turpanensis]